jgi:hypothetical protein
MGALFRLASHSLNLRYKTRRTLAQSEIARGHGQHTDVGEVDADVISSSVSFSRTCFTMRVVRLLPKNRHFSMCV